MAFSCACMMATLLIPGLISGFLLLFRSTLEALFLPFRLLFGLALWLTTGNDIGNAVAEVGRSPTQTDPSWALLHDYLPALLIAAGLLLFIVASGAGRRQPTLLWSCLSLHGGAGVLIGTPIAALLLPALCTEAVALYAIRNQPGSD